MSPRDADISARAVNSHNENPTLTLSGKLTRTNPRAYEIVTGTKSRPRTQRGARPRLRARARTFPSWGRLSGPYACTCAKLNYFRLMLRTVLKPYARTFYKDSITERKSQRKKVRPRARTFPSRGRLSRPYARTFAKLNYFRSMIRTALRPYARTFYRAAC